MSHFAKVIDGIVTDVLVIEQDVIDTGMFGDPSLFIQTSYNTRGGVHYGPDGNPDGGIPLRKNYAGIGYTYDYEQDAFIPPQPFPSWSLNQETCLWDAPTPRPSDGLPYVWDENTLSWVEVIVDEVALSSIVANVAAPLTTVISTVMPPAENN